MAVQSMVTAPTANVTASTTECLALAEAGCQLVRLTAPTVADAQALAAIRRNLDAAGWRELPLCADIHFQPAAAREALQHVEKVRINPGNYADRKITDAADYDAAARSRDEERVCREASAFFTEAKRLGRAVRIGVNHGSLSDRMLLDHGDTSEGMVASALEYVRIAQDAGFGDLVISIKSSRPSVVIATVRRLARDLDALGCPLPLHLGVTEAGSGLEGRVKGAAGIGALLADGLGDTIRVSLTEPAVAEIPVAQQLVERFRPTCPSIHDEPPREDLDPLAPCRHPGNVISLGTSVLGGDQAPRVLGRNLAHGADLVADGLGWRRMMAGETATDDRSPLILDLPRERPYTALRRTLVNTSSPRVLAIGDPGPLSTLAAYRALAAIAAGRHALTVRLSGGDPVDLAAEAGAILADGFGDALWLPDLTEAEPVAFAILQALRLRITRAEIISCPGCGRTRFDLMRLAEETKAALGHLQGLTIGVMGCIVNGPGEMADADFGLVGDGVDTVALYRGKNRITGKIPMQQGLDRLIDLIREAGRWQDT